MLGDYFTPTCSAALPGRRWCNLINNSVLTPGRTGQAGAFVLFVLVVSLAPMLFYVRTARTDRLAS